MKRALWCLLLAGCADPAVRLDLVVPPAYREHVAELALQTLVPGAESTFHCAEASFGLVDAEMREGALESTRILREAGDQSLGTIARTGTKLFWVEGLTEDGETALLGCAELETIEEDRALEIVLEPVRVPVIEGEEEINYELIYNQPVQVRATDIFGEPLASLEARYRSAGAGGTWSGTVTADREGVVEIAMPAGDRAGPIAIDVYTRWSLLGARRVAGFREPAQVSRDVGFIVTDAIGGRFGPGGAPAIVLVGAEAGLVAYRLAIELCSFAGGELECARFADLPNASSINAVKLARPGEENDAFVVLADGALLLFESFGLPPVTVAIDAASVPLDLFPSGECSFGEEVIVTFMERAPQRYRLPEGSEIDTPPITGTLVAAPCVGVLDSDGEDTGEELRIYVADEMSAWLTMHVDAGPLGVVLDSWPVIAYDVNATPAPRMLLGLQPMLSYLTLTRASLMMFDRPYIVPSPIVDVLPQFPAATRGGDLDGDGLGDIASVMLTYDLESRPANRMIWSRLGAELDESAITGAAVLGLAGPCGDAYPTLEVGDLDGDGRDELAIVELYCSTSKITVLDL